MNYDVERAKNALLDKDCDSCYFFIKNGANCIGDPYLYTCNNRIDLNKVNNSLILKHQCDWRIENENF